MTPPRLCGRVGLTIDQEVEDLVGGLILSPFLSVTLASEMPLEPIRSQTRNLFEGSRFLKQVGCARDDHQLFFSFELLISLPVQFDNHVVETAHDE